MRRRRESAAGGGSRSAPARRGGGRASACSSIDLEAGAGRSKADGAVEGGQIEPGCWQPLERGR